MCGSTTNFHLVEIKRKIVGISVVVAVRRRSERDVFRVLVVFVVRVFVVVVLVFVQVIFVVVVVSELMIAQAVP